MTAANQARSRGPPATDIKQGRARPVVSAAAVAAAPEGALADLLAVNREILASSEESVRLLGRAVDELVSLRRIAVTRETRDIARGHLEDEPDSDEESVVPPLSEDEPDPSRARTGAKRKRVSNRKSQAVARKAPARAQSGASFTPITTQGIANFRAAVAAGSSRALAVPVPEGEGQEEDLEEEDGPELELNVE